MAEAIFNSKCNTDKLTAYSAGIAIAADSTISEYSSTLLLEKLNIDVSNRKAIQLTRKIIDEADLIITMNSYMKDLLISNSLKLENKIFVLREYIGVEGEILDPYDGSIKDFRKIYDILDNQIGILISKIKEDNGIV
jgi:protein-tyrosine phosphatase